jgi:hypothetical protein
MKAVRCGFASADGRFLLWRRLRALGPPQCLVQSRPDVGRLQRPPIQSALF